MNLATKASARAEAITFDRRNAVRRCLGGCCGQFLSEGPWNRMCPRCARRNLVRGTHRMPTARITYPKPGESWNDD